MNRTTATRIVGACVALFMALTLGAGAAIAGDCRKIDSVCVDTTPMKNISGIDVTLAQAGGCWKWEDTYDCLKAGTANYCGPLETAGCWVTSATCTRRAFNNDCEEWTKTYRCSNTVNAPNTIKLDDSYTIIQDTLDRSACTSLETNNSCKLAETVCVEGPATRNIDGLDVYKSCWKYEERYTCTAGEFANYCAPLISAGCSEVLPATCTQQAWNSSCIMYDRKYNCNQKLADPLPTNVIYLESNYTVTKDNQDLTACKTYENNPNCTKTGRVCIEGPETRKINGYDVYKACWKYEDTYACTDDQLVSNCDDLKARPECLETTAPVCVDYLPDNKCGLLEHTYECAIGPGNTDTVTDCSNQKFCIGGTCYDSGYPPDTDFAAVVTGMEGLREAANYQLFKGESSKCQRKLFGLVNCCKSSSGGASSSNDQIAMQLGVAGLKVGAEVIKVWGAKYVYEALTTSGYAFMEQFAFNSVVPHLMGNFSIWGASFDVTLGGIEFAGFDPYSLALSVAFQILSSMLTCDEDSKLTGMRRGQGLCHKVGSYCSSKILGACITKKESYCCFVSKLARIINEQGRPQIGKSWGSAKYPDCSGFTVAELEELKFDEMNLSEFISSIQVPSKNANYAIDRLQTRARNYYAP